MDKDCDGNGSVPAGAKKTRQNNLKKTLGENLIVLNVKEIKNLVSVKVLKKVVSNWETNLEGFEPKENEYKYLSLGKYLDLSIKNRSKTSKDGNTVKDKQKFCHLVIENTEEYSELAKNAKQLIEKAYNFMGKFFYNRS